MLNTYLLYGVCQREKRGLFSTTFICGVNATTLNGAIAQLSCKIDRRWLENSMPKDGPPLWGLFGNLGWKPDLNSCFRPHLATAESCTAIWPRDANAMRDALRALSKPPSEAARKGIQFIPTGLWIFDAFHIGRVTHSTEDIPMVAQSTFL